MGRRTIFVADPDVVGLFEELFEDCERDLGGAPLGAIRRHASHRFTVTYMLLALVRLLAANGRLHRGATFKSTGARYQDKRAKRETPAAHALPCGVEVTQAALAPGLVDGPLSTLLVNPVNQAWVQRNVIGATDRVHRLTNLADWYCERAGMIAALIAACGRVNAGDRPGDVFEAVVGDYAAAVHRAIGDLQADISALDLAEHRAMALRDHLGRPLLVRPSDFRRRSPDPKASAANKFALQQVFAIYLTHRPDGGALADGREKIEALRLNEGWRL